MEVDKRNIEDYINRFLEGATTNAEEQAIYRFFRSGDVPSHLREYIPMFAWYEKGMQGEPEPVKADETLRKQFRRHIPVAVWSAGIAAVLVVTLGLGLLFYADNGGTVADEWSCYEGSYIEIDGKRITDIKQIMPCIVETLEKAERVEKLAQERVEEIRRSEKEIREKELLVNE